MFISHSTLAANATSFNIFYVADFSAEPNRPTQHSLRSQICFFAFAESHFQVKDGVLAPSTLKSYRYEMNKLRKFCPTLSVHEIKISFMHRYEQHLRRERGNSTNSISKTVKVIKALLNAAYSLGYLIEKPLENYSVVYTSPKRDFLSISELKKLEILYARGTLNKWKQESLRAFLFSCYCGLRFADVSLLRWQQISRNRIRIRQVKTGLDVVIPMNNRIETILGHRSANKNSKVFRLSSNFKVNRRIKDIIRQVRVNKQITFHCARHSFATLSLNMGVAITSVQALLGHRSVRTTEIYTRLLDQTLVKEMRRWNRVASG